MSKKTTPVAYHINIATNQNEIYYRCNECGCDLRLLKDKQNYCYKCGAKFDWRFCPFEVSESTINIIESKSDIAATVFVNKLLKSLNQTIREEQKRVPAQKCWATQIIEEV